MKNLYSLIRLILFIAISYCIAEEPPTAKKYRFKIKCQGFITEITAEQILKENAVPTRLWQISEETCEAAKNQEQIAFESCLNNYSTQFPKDPPIALTHAEILDKKPAGNCEKNTVE